jgi:hypothetical protein
MVNINTTFLRAVARDIVPDAVMLTATFPGDPHTADRAAWCSTPWRPGNGTWHVRPDHNNYGVVSSFFRDSETGRYRRIKAAFAQLLIVMIDDIGPKVSETKIALPLSGKIMTSPGNCQGLYLIEQSAGSRDFATADRLIKAMIASGLTDDGSDPGMNGVTRYFRLPCGINGKAKYVKKLGHPFQVRLLEWTSGRRYTVEQIAAAYKLNIKAPPPRPNAQIPKSEMRTRSKDFDSLLKTISDAGLFLKSRGEWSDIECPWADEHTDGAISGSAVCAPSRENGFIGGYRCHHGHCEGRTVVDLYRWQRAFNGLKARA